MVEDAAAVTPSLEDHNRGASLPSILYVDQTGELGGGELCLFDIATQLPGKGRVALFTDGPFRERLAAAGVPVEVLETEGNGLMGIRKDAGWRTAVRGAAALGRVSAKVAQLARHTDLIYANSQKALVVSVLAAFRARRPLIWHLHDILDAEHFSPVMRRVAVTAANIGAAAVIANSHAAAEAFITAGGRRKRVRVVYNGMDPKPFDAVSPQQVAHIRAELASPGVFLVGVFGRLSPWKGQHVVLDALAQLPGVSVVFVGEALFGKNDISYAHRLREMAEEGDLRGRVHFLGFREDVPALMRAMDVVVHSSVNPEPFGRVIVEGMLAGRPVLASAAGGVLEILDDGRTGLLYPPGDHGALAGLLRRLQGNAELASRLAEAGRAEALARFSLTAMIEGVKTVVDEVLAGGSR